VLQLDDERVARLHHLCYHYGIKIACIGSPIGKSPIADPLEVELANLKRIFRIAESVSTRMIRVFSFYPPKGTPESGYDTYLDESVSLVVPIKFRGAARLPFRVIRSNGPSSPRFLRAGWPTAAWSYRPFA
jgi:hypothetical protein